MSTTLPDRPQEFHALTQHREDVRHRWLLFVIFAIAVSVRAIDVWRPIDGTIREAWREADTGAIARNFYREGMNLLEPRIDWRGDGPGFVESEFPIYPWLVACLYHVLGYHEELLRVVSFVVSLACCGMFLRLSRRLLPRSAIPVAFAIFALSPLAVRLASAVQPEPLMFLMYLIAVDGFIRWIDHGQRHQYVIALLATTFAILTKVTAAHIGVLFACLCLRRFGFASLKRCDIWFFALISLGVPLLWYWHAHEIWLQYGNSLGISNEAYVRISSGSFLLTLWETVPGLLSIQSRQVWLGAGFFLGMLGLRAARQLPEQEPLQFWLLALTVYLLVTSRTTGESWAEYYHIVGVPVACMLMGLGIDTLFRYQVFVGVHTLVWCLVVGSLASFAAWVHLETLGREAAVMLIIGLVAACAGLAAHMDDDRSPILRRPRWSVSAKVPILVSLFIVIALEGRQIRNEAHPHGLDEEFRSAMIFAEHVPEGELIIASGPSERDQHGLLRAANPSYYFFWMDRKGFTLHDDEQTLEHLCELHDRGADYFVAERPNLAAAPEFEQQVRQSCESLEETPQAVLFDLSHLPTTRPADPHLTRHATAR